MAIAPLNKFITIAVPVAPGEQTLFEANVGTSAIVLYAQVFLFTAMSVIFIVILTKLLVTQIAIVW